MIVVGIDPGKTGGMAVIKDGILVGVQPFIGDINKCRAVYKQPCRVYIERVTASPQMGVVSAFTFGRWFESVVTSATLGSPGKVTLVRPKKWQQSLGCVSKGDKNKLYKLAKKQFPSQYALKMFNKTTADAVLIAHYGYINETMKDE